MTWRVWLPTLLWCQFFLAEYLVSGSWRGAYSYRDDQISELGVKHCVNGGCNTSYWLMDISFVLVGMGLLFWAHPLWKAVETRSQAALFLAAGLGAVVGGAFPENNNWLIHYLGADVFCIFAPIGALFLCARCWHRLGTSRYAMLVLSIVSIACFIAYIQGGKSWISIGVLERAIVYPAVVAMLVALWSLGDRVSVGRRARHRKPL